ncbi:hypothetical protein HK405_005437, partial [Cladochytrium tenue]
MGHSAYCPVCCLPTTRFDGPVAGTPDAAWAECWFRARVLLQDGSLSPLGDAGDGDELVVKHRKFFGVPWYAIPGLDVLDDVGDHQSGQVLNAVDWSSDAEIRLGWIGHAVCYGLLKRRLESDGQSLEYLTKAMATGTDARANILLTRSLHVGPPYIANLLDACDQFWSRPTLQFLWCLERPD